MSKDANSTSPTVSRMVILSGCRPSPTRLFGSVPGIILAPASGPAVAARNATATIPIVTPALADAVIWACRERGTTRRQCHRISPYVAGLPGKQIELAREVLPGASRIGVLANLNDAKAPPQWEELEAAGRKLGLTSSSRTRTHLTTSTRTASPGRPAGRSDHRAADLHAAERTPRIARWPRWHDCPLSMDTANTSMTED